MEVLEARGVQLAFAVHLFEGGEALDPHPAGVPCRVSTIATLTGIIHSASHKMKRTNWTACDLGTTWWFGTDNPKNEGIAAGKEAKHEVFFEQVTSRGRRFGSFPNVMAFAEAVNTTNFNLFEILVVGRPCKLYLDVDYTGEAGELAQVLQKLTAGFKDALNMHLHPGDIRISCASGKGEVGNYVDKVKHSYHIVVNNGFAFRSVQEVRAFVNLAFVGDDRVDRSPYGRNQSFKVIWNSKLNSSRVQVPQDGCSYMEHMVSAFEEHPRFYPTDKLHHAVEKTTRLQVNVPEPVPPERVVYITDDVDIHSVSCLLHYLPNGPSKDHKQPFDVYLAVACICCNEAEPFQTLEHWAKQYQGYSKDKTLRIWNSLFPRLDAWDIRTLRIMVNKACPGVLKTIQDKLIDQVMLPTIDCAAHGIEYIEYTEPRMEPWIDQARVFKHVLVRGQMGLGKTHQIAEMIKNLKPASVLIITPRQLFARSMLGTLRAVLPELAIYKDTPKSERKQHNHIVCQLESLWTLGRTYDMVVMDECESILHQFSSPTIKEFDTICEDFKAIIFAAKHVIHTDAFLGDRSLLTCVNIDPSATRCFIWNKWCPRGRKAYCAGHYTAGKDGLKRAAHLLKDQNNVVVAASCHFAKEINSILEPTGPTAFINAGTSDDVKKELEDVNTYLQPYKHFIYTSAITVGTSYDRRDHFDNLIMYTSACSNNIRDSIQASMRVRHIKSGNLIYGSYPRFIGIGKFDVMSRARLRNILDGREQYASRTLNARPDQMWQQRQRLEEWQKVLWALNVAEDNTSAYLHKELLTAYLELCGYELMESELGFGEQVDAHVTATDYDEIPDVDERTYKQLNLEMQRGTASAEDKLRVIKGDFKYKWVPKTADISCDLVRKMFRVYCHDRMGLSQRICNQRAELNPQGIDLLESIFQDNKAQKVAAVGELCSLLSVDNTLSVGQQIKRSVMEQSCNKVLALKKELQATFDLRVREANGKRGTLRRGLEIINQIFRKYGLTEVVMDGPRKQSRQGGRLVDTSNYTIQEQKAFEGFVQHAVLRK